MIRLYMQEKGETAAVPGADLASGLAGFVILAAILGLGIMPEFWLRLIAPIVAAPPQPV